MCGRIGTGVGGRILLALLTLYAIAIIAPDFYRIGHPLGSFGLNSNGDGLIYDVQGPFVAETESPAWQAGIRPGDRLDLAAMRCIPVNTDLCASMLALWGGLNYVLPDRKATLLLAATGDRPARQVTLVAQPRPRGLVLDFVLLLDQIAGIMFVLGAAWLVWIRPGRMTWGFFAYAIQFNPGQAFQFYAWLQQWPVALLTQDVAECLMQAVGYAGLLLFALRVPDDRADGGWRRVEHVLPVFAALLLVAALASLGSAFGYRTEAMMRDWLFVGFGVDAAALGILLGRRRGLALAGLSTYPLGDLGMPDRTACVSDCRTVADDVVAKQPGRRSDFGGRVRPVVPDQRHPVSVRRRGGAPSDRRQRVDSLAPCHDAGAGAQHAGTLPPPAIGDH